MVHNHPILYLFVLKLATLILVSCTTAPQDTEMIGREFQALDRQFAAAIDRGDAAAAAGLYTEDARFLPPNSDAVVGRDAIQAFIRRMIESGAHDFQFMQAEVHVMGEIAYDRGEIQSSVQPEKGEPMTSKSKYLCIWTRENGEWKIDVCIFNSSEPLPAAEEEAEEE